MDVKRCPGGCWKIGYSIVYDGMHHLGERAQEGDNAHGDGQDPVLGVICFVELY